MMPDKQYLLYKSIGINDINTGDTWPWISSRAMAGLFPAAAPGTAWLTQTPAKRPLLTRAPVYPGLYQDAGVVKHEQGERRAPASARKDNPLAVACRHNKRQEDA